MEKVEEKGEYLLRNALSVQASDIHISPSKDYSSIQYRVGNDLMEVEKISLEFCLRLVSHFKFLAGMDIGEKRKPQNGSLYMFIANQHVNFRLSTLPTMYQESLVIRILPQDQHPALTQLFLFPSFASKILSLTNRESGLIIITGPTGSGKSTTLYSLLNEMNKMFKRNIITLEDPIEKRSEGFLQVQINEKAGITYSTGLKAILRHDPDIIMVGEIRDTETARAAVQASYTGHLVLSTLHTGNAIGAVYRLQELGVNIDELKQSLIGVIAQRLVQLTCSYCGANVCSKHCHSYINRKRVSIAEILEGDNLAAVFRQCKGEEVDFHFKRLHEQWIKGVALGYISDRLYGDVHV